MWNDESRKTSPGTKNPLKNDPGSQKILNAIAAVNQIGHQSTENIAKPKRLPANAAKNQDTSTKCAKPSSTKKRKHKWLNNQTPKRRRPNDSDNDSQTDSTESINRNQEVPPQPNTQPELTVKAIRKRKTHRTRQLTRTG